jgi:hypothetical protein
MERKINWNTISFVFNILTALALVLTTTLFVTKSIEVTTYSQKIEENKNKVESVIVVMDQMKEVDKGLLAQIVEVKGTTSSDIRIINERITNIQATLEIIRSQTK